MFELLEPRRMLAVSLSLDGGGVLRVTGTSSAETIYVTESDPGTGPQFDIVQQVAGVGIPLASVPENMVSRVVIDGQGGDDFLVLQTSNAIGGDVYGGYGNDEIHLQDDAAGASTAHGGYNDDLIVIYRGKGTKAYGESGNDRMISYETANRTYLYGGAGIDRLQGTSATVTDDGLLGLDPVLGILL